MKISALLLTIGEPYTERARTSIERQNFLIHEVVLVRNVFPFHKALNEGAKRTSADFFVQVDADMILDEGCITTLSSCIAKHVGVVVGHLRDPLMGRIVGIKLFRRECFESVVFENSISPDTDFINKIVQKDWRIVYALNRTGERPYWHTFGAHEPDYDDEYVFKKFLMEGQRYRYRMRKGGWKGCFAQINLREHPQALLAQIAMAHGIFQAGNFDKLNKSRSPLAKLITAFLSEERGNANVQSHATIFSEPREAFLHWCNIGHLLRGSGEAHAFRAYFKQLAGEDSSLSFVGIIGLCHGACLAKMEIAELEDDWLLLKPFHESRT